MASEMEMQMISDGKETELYFIHGYGSFAVTVNAGVARSMQAFWLAGAERFLSGEIEFGLECKEEEAKYCVHKYDTIPNLFFMLKVNGIQFDFNLNREEVEKFKEMYLKDEPESSVGIRVI